ncbi:hypothetical protein EI94DRAFT_1704576 [Lactarius quietus]|nr:hypothetical protein EI94DRAFT_1704576 [Lactarius quietus]
MTLEYIGDELSSFEGWALRDLVHYHKRCQDNLVSTLGSFLDSNAVPSNIWVSQREVFPKWIQDAFSQQKQKLQDTFKNPLIKPSSIRGEYLAALISHVHILKGGTFCEELESKLTQALDKESVTSG